MSAPNQGRQSPPPEESSGAQVGTPSNAKGVNTKSNNQEESKSQIEGLSSNPTGPLDEHLKEVAAKTVQNDAGDVKH